jgi:hypothetical protein
MQQNEVGDTLPDGGTVPANDPLKSVRCFMDELQQVWQDEYIPGPVVVAVGP